MQLTKEIIDRLSNPNAAEFFNKNRVDLHDYTKDSLEEKRVREELEEKLAKEK